MSVRDTVRTAVEANLTEAVDHAAEAVRHDKAGKHHAAEAKKEPLTNGSHARASSKHFSAAHYHSRAHETKGTPAHAEYARKAEHDGKIAHAASKNLDTASAEKSTNRYENSADRTSKERMATRVKHFVSLNRNGRGR